MIAAMIKIFSQVNRERVLVCCLLLLVHVALMFVFLADRSPGTDAAASGFPLDDAWIHLVYGRSIAQTGLPYYNDGTLEAGFTSPLWMVFLALAEVLGSVFSLPVVLSVKLLGTLPAWIASLALYELCRKFSCSMTIALVAGVLAAANPVSVFAQVSGMEVALTCALLALTALAFVLERRRLCAVLLGLSILSRPESVVVLILIVAIDWLSNRKMEIRLRIRASAALIFPTIFVALIWICYCLVVTGHPLPNTFYAKYSSAGSLNGFIIIVGEIVLGLPAMFVGIGVVLFIIGAFALLRRATKCSLVVLLIPWVFLAGIALTRSMPSGCSVYFYWLRYAIPALPLLFVPIAMGAAVIANPRQYFTSVKFKPGTTKVLRIAAVVMLSACFVAYPSEIVKRKIQFAWNCQNINEMQVEIGTWVKRNVSKDASILTTDAGAIRYFGERKTVDMLGLNSHELLSNRKLLRDINTKPDSLAAYMRSVGATHCVVFPEFRPSLVNNPDFPQLFSPVAAFSSANYTVATSLQNMLVIYGLNR